MILPLSAISYLFMAVVFFYFSWRLHKNFKKTANLISKSFRNAGILSGISFTLYTLLCFLGTFFFKESFLLGILDIIGEAFYIAGFIYMGSSLFSIFSPRFSPEKFLKWGLIFLLFSILSHIYYFPHPFIDEKGIAHFHKPFIRSFIIIIVGIFGFFLPLIFLFSREAIRKKYLRKKSILIILSIIFFLIGGIIQGLVNQPFIYSLSFLFQALATTFLFLGILSRPENQS